jgi:hypothetical protein
MTCEGRALTVIVLDASRKTVVPAQAGTQFCVQTTSPKQKGKPKLPPSTQQSADH